MTVSKLLPRPGEVPLKAWVMDVAERERVTPSAIWMRLMRTKRNPTMRLRPMAYPKLRRVSRTTVFVKP